MIKRGFRCILFTLIPATLFYCTAVLVLKTMGFGVMEVLRDPAQLTGESSFLGFMSIIGTSMWVSAAAVCFFAALTSENPDKALRELLILLWTLSTALALDDYFLIHDRYINQWICYFVYAAFAAALLLRHGRLIFAIDGAAFLLAGSWLALSILSDGVQDHIPVPYVVVQLFEEAFKFIGAVTWFYFSFRAAAYRRPVEAVG